MKMFFHHLGCMCMHRDISMGKFLQREEKKFIMRGVLKMFVGNDKSRREMKATNSFRLTPCVVFLNITKIFTELISFSG